MVNLGAGGSRRMEIDKKSITEKWTAIRGFLDGSAKAKGKCGCGVVIKAADRGAWRTITKIALPLGTVSAMTAEVIGACVLVEAVDLILNRAMHKENLNTCIKAIVQ